MFNHYFGTIVPLRHPVAHAIDCAFSPPFGWTQHRKLYKGGNFFEDIGHSLTSFASDPVGYVNDRLAEIDKAVIQPVYREVVKPVGKALEKVGQSIANDPITFIATVAATATGQVWAVPLIQMASAAAKGASFDQVLKTGAISAVTTAAGYYGSQWVQTQMISGGTAANPTYAVFGTEISKTTAQSIANAVAYMPTQAAGAVVAGRDPLSAALSAGIGALAPAVVAQIPGISAANAALNDAMSGLGTGVKNAITGVASAAITSLVTGKDMTVQAVSSALSGAINGVMSASSIVSDVFKDDGGGISRFGQAAQGVIADLASTVLTTALVGGKAGNQLAAQLTDRVAKSIGLYANEGFNSLVNSVKSWYDTSQNDIKAYDTVAASLDSKIDARNAYADSVNKTVNDGLSKVMGAYNKEYNAYQQMVKDNTDKVFDASWYLKANPDVAANGTYGKDPIRHYIEHGQYEGRDPYQGYVTQAEMDAAAERVNAAAKAVNAYNDQVALDFKNTYNPKLATFDKEISGLQMDLSAAEKTYLASASKLNSEGAKLADSSEILANKMAKDIVATLDPNFNAEQYKSINNLGAGVDPYTHWLAIGKNEGLYTNYDVSQASIDMEKSRLVADIAKAQGYSSVLQMSPDQYKAAIAKIDTIYGNNLAQLQDATPTNMSQWGAYGVKSLNDVVGKYDAVKAAQYSLSDLSSGLNTWNNGAGYAVPDGMRLASQTEVAKGLAILNYDDNGKPVWVTSNGQDVVKQYNSKTGEIESRGVQISNGVNTTYEYNPDTKKWETITNVTVVGSDNTYEADDLNSIDGFSQLYTLAGMDEKALVTDLGADAAKLGIGAAKTIIEQAQSTGNSTLINTAANVVKAGGGFLQAFAGLSVLAGYAPKDTGFGKFASALTDLGKAGNTAEYTAAINNINKMVGDAKGIGGTLNAIYQGFKSAPAEFLAEYIGVEGFQEVAPFLVGAGASNFARGAALAKGMGEKFAAEYGAKVGLKAAALSDVAESVGGAADGAFNEAYKVARSKGLSEENATKVALDIAAQTGIVSGLLTMGSFKIGGLAMEKAMIGSGNAGGLLGSAIDNLVNFAATGGKVTIKEGLSEAGEEGLTQAFLESRLYQLDSTRDVAANITAAAAFGAIAGGPIAGGTYALSEGTNLVANTLMANPTVAKIVSEAKNTAAGAATAATLLTGLGITGPAQADILDKVYDAGYTSTAEAAAVLKTYDNFNPSQADINALAGATPDAQFKDKADAYVNPRVTSFDEAKAMLTSLGYKPTDAEVQNFVGQIAETTSKTNTASYADQHTVTAAEAQKYLTDLGYKPTTAEINQFVFSGQNINQDTVKSDIAKYADTHTVTTAEAKKYLTDLGYKPTDAEVASFVKSGAAVDQSQVQKDVGAYVDPRLVTTEEATKMLKDLGYVNPTAKEVAAYVKQGDANTTANALNAVKAYVGTHMVTADDVKSYFKAQGYTNITEADVVQFVAQGEAVDKAKVQAAAEAYADPLAVTLEEARQYFTSLGYTPTEKELAGYVGQKKEADIKQAIADYVDPRYVTVDEVKSAAAKEGYTITDKEAAQFVGQFDQAKKLAEVTGYADPLAVLNSEAVDYFSKLNYTPTAKELADFVGQKKEADVATAIAKYVDPRYATLDEVKSAALKEGYTLSDKEAAKYVGQYDQAAQEAAVRAYANPLVVLAEEAKSYFAQEGYTPTVEELQKYTGIRNEADTAKLIYAYADPLAMTEAEARKYMADLGYTQPTASEVSQFVKQAKEADVQKALTTYVDTHQVTQAEVDAFVKQIGYVPSKDELKSYVQQGATTDQQKVMDLLSEYVDPRYVTADEVKAAYDALGLKTPTDADIQKFVGQYAESELAGKTKDYLPIATYNLTQQDIANSQKTVLDKMAEYEKVGLSRDQALDKAIGDVATNLGKTKTEIMGIIGTPAVADNPNTPANEAQAATGIYKTIGDVQSGLETKIGGVQADLAATKKSILDQVALYEQAGIDRDTALSLSIAGVAQDLGTTKTDLLSKIGTTETALKADIAGVKTELSQDIQTVADLVGKPVQLVTQEDLDYVNNILNIKEGQTQPAINLAYDVNRDGKIDITDQTILQNQLKVQQGTNIETKVDPNTGIETKIDTTTGQVIESWNPQTGSKWASTGIYEQLNRQQADSDLKAKAAAATAAKNLDVAKKQSNFNTLLGMVMSAPDVGGQKVTVQQAPLTEIKNIYDWSSIFATPQQASLFPSPYGQVNVFGQSPQAQPGIAGLGALGGQQQQFKFAEGGMIGGDIEVGSGGNVDDLLNILKGNSG